MAPGPPEEPGKRSRCHDRGGQTRRVPDADAFLALARSSPWRWSTLRFTERRRRARTWSEPRHAWLRRPGLLRVEDPSGRLLDVVRGTPTVSAVLGSSPWDPPPPVEDPVFRADGLVAVRPDGAHLEDPMWEDYRWVAELDPAELAEGRTQGSGSPLEVDGLREVEHAGRPAWEALVRPTADYEPRCGCCPLLRSRTADLAEWGPEWLPEAEYPSAELVRLDVGTGVCVWTEALDGTWAGDGHDLHIEAVDEPMTDDLFPRLRHEPIPADGPRSPEEYLERWLRKQDRRRR